MVLDEESDEETFHGLVERARAWLRQSRISISIGSCWSGCNCNPHTQLNEADQRMYEEKKAFYRTRDTIQRRG